MDEIARFNRHAEEAMDLSRRFFNAFPVRRNVGTLKQRHEAGDRNVTCYKNEDGNIFDYQLKFTKEQRQALLDAYKQARPGSGEHMDHGVESEVFVGVLESWGDSIQLYSERKPDVQKYRTRQLESIEVALLKLDEALSKLDSGALGYWYAHVADATAKCGYQLSATDGATVSMLREPFRATVEAGEFRQILRPLVAAWIESTKAAAATLPKHDHQENDDRFATAKALERMVIEHTIAFETSETGFPAMCLHAVFDLGGMEVEKVSYWLKKVADDPDSFARFKDRMAQKFEGENSPPD